MLTFDEYLVKVSETQTANPRWRLGQTYFNVLYKYRPDLSEQIRATSLDPFHTTSEPTEFLKWVKENW